MDDELIEMYAPAYWASVIINDDYSGLEDEEEEGITEWIADFSSRGFDIIDADVDDTNFMKYHDAYAFFPYAADCCVFRFIKKD